MMTTHTSTAQSDVHKASSTPPFKHMVWIPGGTFLMGSNDFYPEERPVHRVAVDGFWMDQHPVTNAEFRRFVKATGYRTVAERQPNPNDYPGADPRLLMPGSLVFRRPSRQSTRLPCLVGLCAGRVLEASRRASKQARRA